MFVNNWYKMLKSAVMYNSPTIVKPDGATQSVTTYDNFKCINIGYDGTNDRGEVRLANVLKNITATTSKKNGGVAFGNGTSVPSMDDYTLSGSLVTAFTASALMSKTGNTITVTYTLTAEADITISEIGLFSLYYSGDRYPFLVERTLLDAPVTIPAGGVGQVVYTITYNDPTAT